MEFAKALHEWHEFFFLVGTAGATLVALLFVAVSLGAGFLTAQRANATRTFFTPVVIHFSVVFVTSAVTLAPGHNATFFAALIGVFAITGLLVSAWATAQLLRHKWSTLLEDRLAYGLLPAACYVALCVAAAMIYAEQASALDVLAGALLLLLIVNIRNAWDLTLAMVRRHADPR